MNTRRSSLRHHVLLPFLLMLMPGLLLGGSAGAGPVVHPAGSPEVGAPTVVSYQGVVTVSGSPFSGTGYFKFAVVNAAGTTSYWSNDGTSSGGGQPTASVALAVAGGQFTVLLGDTTLAGMTQELTPGAFTGTERYLRVWFSADGSTFTQLVPDTRIAAVPYALQAGGADVLDGLHGSAFQQKYAGVVVVAKSGGDYGTVQAAIDSITTASATNPYLVWVAPGVYTETVVMKPYVHVQGAGQDATVIGSTVSSAAWPPRATVALTRSTSLRDVTVRNLSTAAGTSYRAAVVGRAGVTETLVAGVTAQTLGAGGSNTTNCALALFGPGTSSVVQDVSLLAQSAASNYALYNATGAAATVRGGAYTARGGTTAYGLYNTGSGTTLVGDDVTLLGESGTGASYGLYATNGAATTLQGGAYTARGDSLVYGIAASGSGATLAAGSVSVLAEGGITTTYGLYGAGAAAVTLQGGTFTARGGADTYGIYMDSSGTTLATDGVTVLAESATGANFGLYSYAASVVLQGGSFTARSGTSARAITNRYAGALVADNVVALAESGTDENFGLYVTSGSVTLRGGAFTARGGTHAYGICNTGSMNYLFAYGITATGDIGLFLDQSAQGTVTQSTLEGSARAFVLDNAAMLDLSNSRLVGGPNLGGGAACTAVSSGNTFYENTCP